MPGVQGGELVRRTARKLQSGHLIEDIWKTGATSERILSRAFKQSQDMEVVVQLAETDTDEDNLPWEDRLMSADDATRCRAIVARLICHPSIARAYSSPQRRRSVKWSNLRTQTGSWRR